MSPATEAEYFERAAISNRLVGHVPEDPLNKRFFVMGIEELTGDIRGKFRGLSLVLEMSTASDGDSGSDNPYLYHNKGFWIVHPLKNSEDYAERLQLTELCYQASLQFWSKLRNDKKIGIFKGMIAGTWNMTPFLHLDGTAVGYRCTYRYEETAPTQLNVADWTNETLAE